MCIEEHNYIKWMKDERCQRFPGRVERQRRGDGCRERARGRESDDRRDWWKTENIQTEQMQPGRSRSGNPRRAKLLYLCSGVATIVVEKNAVCIFICSSMYE